MVNKMMVEMGSSNILKLFYELHGAFELDIWDVWRVRKSPSNFLCTEVYYILHSTQKRLPYRDYTQRQQLS